jgi:hypothetical protein
MVEGRVLWDGRTVRTVNAAKTLREAEEWRSRIAASLKVTAAR